ncbi:DMT family transporter [Desulfovibrio inopinatus]|uniref:DMT family transporter n=1 Tax=Desulfovibrio inopinatus TaxID=102109 RepID=UPI00040D8FBC|nr:DMT family transporter [Desulfovibrio inopinatus]
MLQLIIGAFLISFSPVFVKLAGLAPEMAAMYRNVFGALIFVAYLSWRPVSTSVIGAVWPLAIVASLFFGADLTFWHASIHIVGPGMATMLVNFQVFFLAFLAMALFREFPAGRFYWGMILALFGLYAIVGMDAETRANQALGITLALVGAFLYACFIATFKLVLARAGSQAIVIVMTMVSVSTAIILALYSFVSGTSFAIPSLFTLAMILCYALACHVVGWFLISQGLTRVPAATAGLVLLLQPTFAYIWDLFFFDKTLGPTEGIGVLLALAGIYLGSSRKMRYHHRVASR